MKKFKFLQILSIAGLIMASCANDTMEPTTGNNVSDDDVQGYLSVNIIAPSGVVTRGDVDENYKDGSASENQVNMVRFYFFDDDGNPFGIRKNPNAEGSYYCYYDWTPTEADNNGNGDATETVEKIMKVTIPLLGEVNTTGEASVLPDRLVAVLNPSKDVLDLDNPTSKDQLNNLVKNYTDGLTDRNFVITNSVYLDNNEDKNVIDYTEIKPDLVKHTYEEAQANPLRIYVERVVARLDLTIGGENVKTVEGKENTYETGVTYKPVDNPTIDKKVYVKFLGWSVTSTPTTSYLVKNIDPNWDIDFLNESGLEPWSVDAYHRSFWALNPSGVEYQWYSYNEIFGGGAATKKGVTMDKQTVYMHENANPATGGLLKTARPTQVIVAAQLVDEDGEELEIAEYYQQKYTLSGLKDYVAGRIYLFRKDNQDKYTQIKPTDLTFMTKAEWSGEAGPDEEDSYYVYFTLTDDAAKEDWYSSPTNGRAEEDDYVKVDPEKINQYIYDSANRAMVWKGGATYYFFTVKHLGEANKAGEYGIVRNHIYDAIVTKVAGLGTPVWNPNEVIYPEPVDNSADNLLAAEIRVLMWRLVQGKYEFSW